MNLTTFLLLLPFLILLIWAGAVLSKRWEQRWRARQQAKAEAQPKSMLPQDVSATLQHWRARWQEQAPKLRQMVPYPGAQAGSHAANDLTQPFLAWAETAFVTEPALSQWLRSSPERGQQLLTQSLAAFCSDLGFELEWLVNRWLEIDPPLQAVAQGVVAAYCSACSQAVVIYPDVQLLQPYLALRAAPGDKANRQFGLQLYKELGAAGLTPPAPAELMTADDATRWGYVMQAIEQAAAATPAHFCALVQQIARRMAATPAPAPGPAPAQPDLQFAAAGRPPGQPASK